MNFKHKNSLMISPILRILKFLVPILHLCIQYFCHFVTIFSKVCGISWTHNNLRDLEAEDGLIISGCFDFHLLIIKQN